MAKRKPPIFKNKKVVRIERISPTARRLVLSCGHVCIIADPVLKKTKLPVPTRRRCFKCVSGTKPEVKLPKRKPKKKGTDHDKARTGGIRKAH
jgi:hypothetical protein